MAKARALQIPMPDALRARITKIASDEKIPEAQVGRDLLEHSIDWRERLSEKRTML